MKIFCVCCEKYDQNHSKKLKVHQRNIRLIQTIKEDIQEGSICENCYSLWKRRLKTNPKMNLNKLFCGICKLEETETTFDENFQKVDGTNFRLFEKLTGKKNVVHGPICKNCDCKYLKNNKETIVEKEVVDLRKYFKDEFLNLPEISKIIKN
jgi:hypothetical protein